MIEAPTVCRVKIKSGEVENFGIGTITDEKTVLTCAHLFTAGRLENITLIQDGTETAAAVKKVKRGLDVAILEAAESLKFHKVQIADRKSDRFELVRYCGCTQSGEIYWKFADCWGCYNYPERCIMIVKGAAQKGDSGAPIVTKDGKLAGVLWGVDDYENIFCTWIGGNVLKEKEGETWTE